jgi:putative endonuclease
MGVRIGHRGEFGRTGEDIATGYLEELGFRVISRNVRYRFGEIDVVARRGDSLHFIEVKTRSEGALVPARESVSLRKTQRIKKAAEAYLAGHPEGRGLDRRFHCHFDLIAIDFAGGFPEIEHIVDAFE